MRRVTHDDEDHNRIAGPFVALNKNFCNYPLARDIRSCAWQWLRDPTTRRWHGNVYDAHKRNQRLELRFASDVDLAYRRAPTAFEVNILGLILATAQRRNNASVTFNAQAEMLRALGYGIDTRNRQLLRRALEFWQEITLHFGQWFEPARNNKPQWPHGRDLPPAFPDRGRRMVRELPPPVRSFVLKPDGRVTVQLRPDWLTLHRRFFEKVPLPLPHDAATQNLVLAALVSIKDRESHQGVNDKSVIHAGPRGYRQFCKAIGLNHSRRGQVLARALGGGQDWFARNGGSLECDIDDDLIFFTIHKLGRQQLLGPAEQQQSRQQQSRRDKKRRRRTPRVPFAVSEAMFAVNEEPELIEARDEEGHLYLMPAEDFE
jgi:hypothetical protein